MTSGNRGSGATEPYDDRQSQDVLSSMSDNDLLVKASEIQARIHELHNNLRLTREELQNKHAFDRNEAQKHRDALLSRMDGFWSTALSQLPTSFLWLLPGDRDILEHLEGMSMERQPPLPTVNISLRFKPSNPYFHNHAIWRIATPEITDRDHEVSGIEWKDHSKRPRGPSFFGLFSHDVKLSEDIAYNAIRDIVVHLNHNPVHFFDNAHYVARFDPEYEEELVLHNGEVSTPSLVAAAQSASATIDGTSLEGDSLSLSEVAVPGPVDVASDVISRATAAASDVDESHPDGRTVPLPDFDNSGESPPELSDEQLNVILGDDHKLAAAGGSDGTLKGAPTSVEKKKGKVKKGKKKSKRSGKASESESTRPVLEKMKDSIHGKDAAGDNERLRRDML